jgi:hypothetical protein
MKPLLIAALAATALAPLVAVAGDTTVIHERYVEPGQPATVAGVTTSRQSTTTTQRTVVRRHIARRAHYVAPRRHRAVRHARYSAATTSSQTATTTAVVAPPTPPTAVHRRTVIHRYDDGTVRRHTTVSRENPDGTVSTYEHRSMDVPADSPPM